MTDDSKPKNDELDHQDEDKEVVESTSASAAARDNDDDDDDDDDDDHEAPIVKSSAPTKSKPGVKQKKRLEGRKSRPHGAKATSSGAPKTGGSVGIIVAAALVAGAAAGWFANDARGKAPNPEVHAATAAGETPCDAWGKEVCKGAGEKSSACTQAKGAAELLPDAACGAALADIPATLTKVKAARAECTKLVDKLCTDLGKETGTCKMVTERTETFPTDRCKEMMANYDKVLGQLKTMEERGGPPGGPGGPHGAGGPPGMPGAPPGMHGAPPGMHGGPPGMPGAVPPGAIRLSPSPTKAPAPGAKAPSAPVTKAPSAPVTAPSPH